MSVRNIVADALSEGLDATVTVVSHASGTQPTPGHHLVMVMLEEMTPSNYSGHFHAKVQVVLAVAATKPGDSDDALELHLGNVLGVLDETDWINWTSAKRSLYLPEPDSAGFPAFTIDLEIEVQ